MSSKLLEIKEKILNAYEIKEDEALDLALNSPLDELLNGANELRKSFCGEEFSLCTVMNIKSGKCSEDCKYCAQSSFYKTNCQIFSLKTYGEILKKAKFDEENGADYFSLVSSGLGLKEGSKDLEKISQIYKNLKGNLKLNLCASLGVSDRKSLEILKESGVKFYHHNLETSRRFFPFLCTTHSFDDRIQTIKTCQEIGLGVCSGGIFGVGENLKDRISLAFELKNLGIKMVPINILSPIAGTPLGNAKPLSHEEILRSMAIFRFILPRASLKFAGGRKNLGEDAIKALKGGINSAITGDFLTTKGDNFIHDKNLFKSAGFKVEKEVKNV